jgi:hypothetical protein
MEMLVAKQPSLFARSVSNQWKKSFLTLPLGGGLFLKEIGNEHLKETRAYLRDNTSLPNKFFPNLN